MKRSFVAGILTLVIVFAGAAGAQEPGGEFSEIEKLVQAFLDAETHGDLVVASDPDAVVLSPFGGVTALPIEITEPVSLVGSFGFLINPGDSAQYLEPGTAYVSGALRPPGGSAEAWALHDVVAPGDAIPGLGAGEMLEMAMLRDFFAAAGSHELVGEGNPFSGGPIVIHGGFVQGLIPLDCSGLITEFGRVDALSGAPIWDGFAENDVFNGGSQAIVTRCSDGQWMVDRLLNQGERFVSTPTNTITAVFPQGWMSLTPVDEFWGTTGSRTFAFVTPSEDPYRPETTGFTAVPTFPELLDAGFPMMVNDPDSFLVRTPVGSHVSRIGFSGGTCQPESWSGPFEVFVLPGPDTPLLLIEQMTSGQTSDGMVGVNPDGSFSYLLEGSGIGYLERYQWSGSTGSYFHENGEICTWDLVLDPEWLTMLDQDVTGLIASMTTTTSTTSPGSSQDVESSFPWVLVALGLIGLGVAGWFLFGGVKDPCEDLKKAWLAAEQRRKSTADALKQAESYLAERRAKVAERVGALAGLESAADSSMTESGVTYHLIEGGKVTSEGLASLTATARRDLADARRAEADAENSVADWEDRLERATKEAEDAKSAYERCVGENTPTTAPAVPKDPGVPGGVGGVGVTSGAPAEETGGCRPGDREIREAGKTDSINVTVDFSIFIEVLEGSGRQVEAGKTLAIELSDLAGELGALGSLLGAYGSGRSVGQGALGLQAGKYTVGGGKLARGGVQGYIAGADPNIGTDSFPISIPTSPQEAVTEVLEATARLGSLVAGKVAEWMEMNQLLQIRMTYFFQTITATPYEVWVCDEGRWVCQEKIFELTVSGLQRRPGPKQGPFRLESDMARHQMDREVQRMVGRGRSDLQQSVRRRVTFEQAHQPGPCQ